MSTDFVNYLTENLIPDLRDAGFDATADDFQTAAGIIARLTKASTGLTYEERLAYLVGTESMEDFDVLYGRLTYEFSFARRDALRAALRFARANVDELCEYIDEVREAEDAAQQRRESSCTP